jgi:polyferredoxin
MKLKIRYFIQLFIFALIGLIAVNHNLAEQGKGIAWLSQASLHAICPFGGVVTIYNLLTVGTFVKKIHASAVVLMAIVLFTAILFGPAFCGWICPLGSIQEWIGKIGRKIFGKRYNHFLPQKVDGVLRYLRYVIFGLVVYLVAVSGTILFSAVDPYYALFNFWNGEATLISIAILIVTLLLSLVVERPWCKYLCPYGAFLGTTNLIRVFKIRRSTETCINCMVCNNVCPMNIEISEKEQVLNHQCISCLECTSEQNCPIENTVQLSTRMRGENK